MADTGELIVLTSPGAGGPDDVLAAQLRLGTFHPVASRRWGGGGGGWVEGLPWGGERGCLVGAGWGGEVQTLRVKS